MSAELVESELGRDRERGLCETAPFLGFVRDLRIRAREGENSCRRDRDRVAGESLGAREMLEDEIVLAAIPEDACEVRLRLGCVLGIACGEEGVTRSFECVLLTRLVVGLVQRNGTSKQELRAAPGRSPARAPARRRTARLRRRGC